MYSLEAVGGGAKILVCYRGEKLARQHTRNNVVSFLLFFQLFQMAFFLRMGQWLESRQCITNLFITLTSSYLVLSHVTRNTQKDMQP